MSYRQETLSFKIYKIEFFATLTLTFNGFPKNQYRSHLLDILQYPEVLLKMNVNFWSYRSETNVDTRPHARHHQTKSRVQQEDTEKS